MKKIFLLTIIFCAIPVAALWEGGHQTSGDKAVSGIAFLLPQIDSDFSDLDVRDAQNHPISTPSANQALENLFRENLIQLTVFAAPHVVSELFDWLDAFSHLFNKSFYARAIIIFELFQEAFLPSSKRFVHNVHNLWITLSVALFMCCSLLSRLGSIRAPSKLYLRC